MLLHRASARRQEFAEVQTAQWNQDAHRAQIVESVALPRSVLNMLKGKGHHGHLFSQTREKGNRQTLR